MNKIFEINGIPDYKMKVVDGFLEYRSICFVSDTHNVAAEGILEKVNFLLEKAEEANSIVYWRVRPQIIFDTPDDEGKEEPVFIARCRLAIYPEIDEKHWEFVKYNKECD